MTLCLGPTWAHNWSYVNTFGGFGASKLDCFSCDQLEKKKKKRRVAAGGMAEEGDAQKNNKKLKLYSFWGSSCSCRVRIALNLKGLEYEYVPVNVLKGEQYSPDFLKLNPIGYVPALVDGDVVLADSFAILMYLEEKYPQHPLLPADLNKKAINFQAATIVSSSIQPVQNLAYQKYVEERMSLRDRVEWVKHHIGKGFSGPSFVSHLGMAAWAATILAYFTLENILKEHAGKYATGNEICLADVFLAPQIHVAIKIFNLDMSQYPLLSKLNEAYMELPAFQHAMPENQPDTPLSTA